MGGSGVRLSTSSGLYAFLLGNYSLRPCPGTHTPATRPRSAYSDTIARAVRFTRAEVWVQSINRENQYRVRARKGTRYPLAAGLHWDAVLPHATLWG
jgi:hypothetical protein